MFCSCIFLNLNIINIFCQVVVLELHSRSEVQWKPSLFKSRGACYMQLFRIWLEFLPVSLFTRNCLQLLSTASSCTHSYLGMYTRQIDSDQYQYFAKSTCERTVNASGYKCSGSAWNRLLVSRGCLAFLCVRAVCTSLNSVPFWVCSEWPARICFVVSVTGTYWRWACWPLYFSVTGSVCGFTGFLKNFRKLAG